MVPQDLLGESNGVLQTLREGLRLIAPLVGALIYASVGGGAVAVLDSASFVAVVISLAFIKLEEPRFEREEHHFVTELLAGVRHVFATLPLRQIVLATGVCLLVVGFAETLDLRRARPGAAPAGVLLRGSELAAGSRGDCGRRHRCACDATDR